VLLAPPARYEVDGLSMAPGLQPGDVVATGWFPAVDRLRQPRRHERWILTSPAGTPAIKRVIGLPGETVSIRDGDLAIGGRTVLKPPALLAEMASTVPETKPVRPGDTRGEGGWQRAVTLPIIYDDAAFAPTERRLLLPVRDVGVAAVIRVPESPAPVKPLQVRVRVGDVLIPWRIQAGGRYAVVAGRLDGHLVGAAWPLDASARWTADARSALPPQAPAAWDVAESWPDSMPSDTNEASPLLGLGLARAGLPLSQSEAETLIEQVAVWRDLLHRPAADGVVEWRIGSDAFFVLGDFPSGSRDSRHWNPLGRGSLRHRVASPR
jgi:signal peptidase I